MKYKQYLRLLDLRLKFEMAMSILEKISHPTVVQSAHTKRLNLLGEVMDVLIHRHRQRP